MSLIDVADLSFTHSGSYDSVFEHVSFQIDTNWKLGFLGRNGRGKTTFLNLLLGKYEYSGTISAAVPFEYFPYPVSNPSETTLAVIRHHCPDALDWEITRELSLLHVPNDVLCRPFDTLSNGEQTKALLVSMFLKENSFLLIDEPTNHLDVAARGEVGAYLSEKQGFLLVSHDRVLLDRCVNHILSINKTNIEIQSGNFSSWWRNKQMQDGFELAENQKLEKDRKRLSAAAQRTGQWSEKVEQTKYGTRNSGLRPDRGFLGHKSAKMMARSKSIEARQQSAIDEKSKLLKNIETNDPLKLSPLVFHAQRLLSADNLALSYGEKQVCSGVCFTVEQGDRIALCGKNGCGKSSVLKLLLGESIAHTGNLSMGSQLEISYVPQSTDHLSGGLSDYAAHYKIDESLFKVILRKLDFSRAQFEKSLEQFSDGQKKKVLLARSLCQPAHLYIWDEPLNYIDIFSRMQVEELLLSYRPTMLFVEHDRAFCDAIQTKQILL